MIFFRFVTAAFLLILSSASFSQQNWCGTIASPEFLQSYSSIDRSHQSDFLAQRSDIRWIPVWYHIIVRNDGTGGINLKDVFISHCELNELFNPFKMGFFIQGIDTIYNTALWEYQSFNAWGSVFSQNNKSNTCNVYVNGNLPGLCGFATLPYSGPAGGGIFLNKSCVGAGEKTYAHEMGHYMGLLHTFETGFGIELVNGSNCVTAGDLFCDTPADFLDNRTSCPYLGNQTDPNGDLYKNVIDPTLIMSYFNDNCVTRFSTQQQAEMNRVLSDDRRNLLTIPPPNLAAPASVQMIYPMDGEETVNSNLAQFKWRSVPGARYYHFRVQSLTSPLMLHDTIVTDTSFIVNGLVASRRYRFFVKAISLGNACGSDAPFQIIQTSGLRASVTVSNPTCSGGGDGMVAITPVNGAPPYAFQWADGSQDSILYNLSPGDYFVTVVDNNGSESVILVTVSSPPPMNVQFNIGSNSLVALASGGEVPYSFVWSNGVVGQINGNLPYGNYSVTVTDAKGCSSVQNILYNSIPSESEPEVQFRLFPNPAPSGAVWQIQTHFEERTSVRITVFTMNGQIVKESITDIPSGEHYTRIGVNPLPAGVYFVRMETGFATRTERISIISR